MFAPLLALSGLVFPLNSNALCASLELTLLLLLTWVIAVTVVIARRAREPQMVAATAQCDARGGGGRVQLTSSAPHARHDGRCS